MSYVTKQALAELRQIDALSYCLAREPTELIRDGNNAYHLRSEHSCKITPQGFYAWSRGIGGKTAIDYLVRIRGCTLPEACEILDSTKVVKYEFDEPPKGGSFQLPSKNINNNIVISYLAKRGIDKEIINFCIENKMLYEEQRFHTAVFVGYNARAEPEYAFVRGTTETSHYRKEVLGSRKKFSFRIATPENTTINVFESAIDALSFATILKQKGIDWQSQNYLSLSGVYQTAYENDDPMRKYPALSRYLEEFPNTRQVCLCFDNDHIGRQAGQSLKELLQEKYDVKLYFPPNFKDWNEYTKNIKKEMERVSVKLL